MASDGLSNLNPADTLLTVTRRGDDYFVVQASVNNAVQPDPALPPFDSPVWGFCLSPDSDVDMGALRFEFPSNGPSLINPETGGSESPPAIQVDRILCVGSPFMFRLPPTGIQSSASVSLETYRFWDPSAQDNGDYQLPTCLFEVYVILKPPGPGVQVPMTRRPKVYGGGLPQGGKEADTEYMMGFAFAYGRKHVCVYGKLGATFESDEQTVTVRVYQQFGTPSSRQLLYEKEIHYVSTEPVVDDTYFYEGELRGAQQIVVTWENTTTEVVGNPSCSIEVRD